MRAHTAPPLDPTLPSAAVPDRSPITSMTVVYDDHCAFCDWSRRRLERRRRLVPIATLGSSTTDARSLVPDPEVYDTGIVVVADDGRVWTGTPAYVVALWAIHGGRAAARILAHPPLRWLLGGIRRFTARYRGALGRLLRLPAACSCSGERCGRAR